MRITTIFSMLVLLVTTAVAQIPSSINYQGLARDASGAALSNRQIALRISVREGDAMGPVRYSEVQVVRTDDLGVFSLHMGEGENRVGNLADLAWGQAQHWLQVELDEKGGDDFQLLGSSQLLSVPYAFYAHKAGSLSGVENVNTQGGVPSNVWHINGNSRTDPDDNFVGTTDNVGLSFRTNDVERMRLTEDGKLGIGTSDPLSTLAIAGNLAVGAGYASTYAAPTNGAIIEGSVGIGTPTPASKTDIEGNVTIGAGYAGTTAAPSNGLLVEGTVGIGTTTPASKTDIEGNVTIGAGYAGTTAAPTNGALIEGALGLGTTTPMNKLDVEGNAAIGAAYSGNVAAPANGALIEGALGLGTTTPMNKLDVEGNLAVGAAYSGNHAAPVGGAIIHGSVGIGTEAPTAKLDVVGNTRLRGDAAIEGSATIGGPLTLTSTVQSTSPTTGALIVAGGAGIGMNLNVGGNSWVGGNSTVVGNGLVSGKLGVGASNASAQLNITAPSSLTYPLYAEVSGTSNRFSLNNEGQLYLRSTKTGSSDNTGNYAMFLDGQDQGMLIRLNTGAHPNSSNHYMTFIGSTNVMRGRIEGLTQTELYNSFEYIWHNVMMGLDEAFVLAEGVATAAQIDLAEAVVMAVEGAAAYAQWVEWLVEMDNSVGIAFESGSGDYAEWMEKADPSEQYTFGDIVGVHGGKISRNTVGADQLMVVSMAPIVIGNMPAKGREAEFEKVAFVGQVPVKVKGVVRAGDYIVASGSNDGTGYAVTPEKMTLSDYTRLVGIAWSDAASVTTASYVRVAVGVNGNVMVRQLVAQQQQIDELRSSLDRVMAHVGMKADAAETTPSLTQRSVRETNVAPVAAAQPVTMTAAATTSRTDLTVTARTAKTDRIRRLIAEKPDLMWEGLQRVKEHLVSKGIDINASPELRRLFSDRASFLRQAGKVMGAE